MKNDPKAVRFLKIAAVAFLFSVPALAQKDLTIAAVQGALNISQHNGQQVRVSGIVTARTRSGFFIQTPDDKIDPDPNTSEGIFVFTGTRGDPPADAAPGSLISVTGKVEEFRRDNEPLALTITEISHRVGNDQISVVSKANALPKPVTLSETDFKANKIDQLERFEGMRITVAAMTVVSPTGGREDTRSGAWISDGVFLGVLKGIPKPFREPGLDIREFLASPDQEKLKREVPKLPIFDFNPEVIRVDFGEQTVSRAANLGAEAQSLGITGGVRTSAPALNVTSNTELSNLVGVLHYAFGRPTLLPDPDNKSGLSGGIKLNPMPVPTDRQFVVVGMNIENFFDDKDDVEIREPVANTEAFERRLKKISFTVRELMRLPDVIGCIEIENLRALKTLADRINADSVAAGKPDPKYTAHLTDGNDGRGIDNGFLIKTSRVSTIEIKQIGKDDKYQNPNTKQEAFLNDRPPLVLRASINDSKSNKPFEFTVVVNHLKSYSGFNDPKQMANVRMKKHLQSELLARWIDGRQKANPSERLILIGDFNSYQFSDGVLDMIGTIKGKPSAKDSVMMASNDLVNPDLTDLVDVIAATQRYSFMFDGNAQTLDHMLITQNMTRHVNGFGFLRINADYPEILRNDASRPERFSDHDPAIAYFTFDDTTAPRP